MSEDHQQQSSAEQDVRLYLPNADGWVAKVKQGWTKESCSLQNPGEDYFHLLMNGEIYLQQGVEKYCLRCALRRGLITRDRLSWQRLSIKEGSEGPNVEEFAFQFKTPVQATPHPPRPVDTDAVCTALYETGYQSTVTSVQDVSGSASRVCNVGKRAPLRRGRPSWPGLRGGAG